MGLLPCQVEDTPGCAGRGTVAHRTGQAGLRHVVAISPNCETILPMQVRATRKPVRLALRGSSGLQEGSGQLVNISMSGTLLESSNSLRPGLGRSVKLRFRAPKVNEEIELSGTVARQTRSGFAIQFFGVTSPLELLMASL